MSDFETIYRTYFTDVELYLRAICHDEGLAEELTEQVFFQALKALPRFRGECDIRTWLCSMGRNCYLSYLRKSKPEADIDSLQIPDPKQAIEDQFIDRDQAMRIHRVLHMLPEPYKEVFPCGYLGNYPLRISEASSGEQPTGPVLHTTGQNKKYAMKWRNSNENILRYYPGHSAAVC